MRDAPIPTRDWWSRRWFIQTGEKQLRAMRLSCEGKWRTWQDLVPAWDNGFSYSVRDNWGQGRSWHDCLPAWDNGCVFPLRITVGRKYPVVGLVPGPITGLVLGSGSG